MNDAGRRGHRTNHAHKAHISIIQSVQGSERAVCTMPRDTDTHTLLPVDEDEVDVKVSWTTLARVLGDVLDTHYRVFVACVNVACVAVLTLCLLGVDKLRYVNPIFIKHVYFQYKSRI